MKKISANWKRLTVAILALLAVLGMTACGKQNQDNTPPAQKEDASQNENSAQQDETDEDVWIGWPDFGEEGIELPVDEWD